MTKEHPITPPPELVQQWAEQMIAPDDGNLAFDLDGLATSAARWGADQELEACVSYVDTHVSGNRARALREARRPKSPSLKELALAAQQRMWDGESSHADWELICRALESLPD